MQENEKFFCGYKRYKVCPNMEIPTTKYLADYLYVVHEDVPFRYYRKTKCSIFRGLVLCICLNVTYANIVRFPRELDMYGLAYLVPYVSLLFLVGLPITLLEISVGQFLGQGAAHTWRASPIFKGACIIARFASWLSTVWVSLQAVMALAYIGMFIFGPMPFRECVGNIKLAINHYTVTNNSGQECLQTTFLTPFWENPFYFGVLSLGLICIWIIVMLCTHNGRILRRSLFFFGLLGFVLLCCLTGWEVNSSFERPYFPDLWAFDKLLLYDSGMWFGALMQVLFSTNSGFGALPMLTGKFLYKGDAVRTSVVYICFNLLVNAIAVTLFMVQFDFSSNGANMIEELKPLTAIYDRILNNRPDTEILIKLIPILIYSLVLIAAFVSLTVAIYTATRIVPRHPNYVIGLIALVVSIMAFAAPRFIIARILDTRVVGTLLITAVVFDLIAMTWIYGAKNIYTDLEFSIGRPIFKGWMVMWCICPAILTGLLVWWCSDDDQYDLMADYVPRWAPIIFALAIIFIIACIQIIRQVEYNFFGMICEASKPAKEWGPADPLARHAWKQWRSVCQDTGQRDFTLRRRGTRDYTHSIKKGQYSTSNAKQANGHVPSGQQQQQQQQQHHHHQQQLQQQQHQQQQLQQQSWKTPTSGNSSPNYSGSMYGDSAIEEDISVDKFPGINQQFVPFQNSQHIQMQTHQTQPHHQHQYQLNVINNSNESKPLRYSHHGGSSNTIPHDDEIDYSAQHQQHYQQPQPQQQQLAKNRHYYLQPANSNQQRRSTTTNHVYSQPYQGYDVNRQKEDEHRPASVELHREIVYIKRASIDESQYATRIQITPSNESITYGGVRNPLGRYVISGSGNSHVAQVKRSASAAGVLGPKLHKNSIVNVAVNTTPRRPNDNDHVCWRKYTNGSGEENATEL